MTTFDVPTLDQQRRLAFVLYSIFKGYHAFDEYLSYVPCSGCGLRNYNTDNPLWQCPDYPKCAEGGW